MKDKTKEQLIAEIELLRKEVAELEQEKAEQKWAEEGIKAKSHFLESLIEQSPLPTFVIDSGGICVMLNKAFLKAYNVPQKEMVLGRNALTEPANVRQGVVKYIKEALSGKIVETPETEFISPYEKKRTVTKSKLFPIFDATNKLTNVVVIHEDITARKRAEEALRKAYDELEMRVEERTAELAKANEELWIEITERKRAEEALKESEQKYRFLVENLSEIVLVLSRKGKILFANKKAVDTSGYPKEQIVGQSILKFLTKDSVAKAFYALVQEFLGRPQPMLQVKIKTRSGEIRDLEIAPGPAPVYEKGKQIGILINGSDITERKGAEEALQESEEKYRTTFENTGTAMAIIEEDTIISLVNSQFEKLAKYSKEEIEGKKRWTEFVHQEDLERMKEYHRRRREPGGKAPTEYEFRFVDREGNIKNIFLTIEVIPGTKKSITSLMDITERKRAEEEIKRRAAQAMLGYEVGQRVSSKLELDELLSEIVTAVRDAFDYYGVMILLVDEEAQCLTMQSIAGGYADIFPKDLYHAIGEGMTGYAVASGKTQVSGNVSKDPHYVREADEETKSELAVPIKKGQKVSGVLDIQSDEFDAFDETGVMLMETLADQIAVAIENARLYEAVQQELAERKKAGEEIRYQKKYFQSLFESSPEAVVSLDPQNLIVNINPAFEKIFGYTLEDIKGKDIDDCIIPRSRKKEGRSLSRRTWEGEVVVAESVRKKADGGEIPVSILGAPIILGDKRVGMFAIYRDITERKKAQEQLENSFIDLAETVSRAMEARDPYTSGHQRRVAELARLVGEKMGLDKDRLQGLHIGGLLHDIGKISTPESILAKPGRLSDEEWSLIHAHAKQGYLILKGTNLPWPVADMAVHHHERLDGSGYPHGISGDKLSLEVRILGVCDVVEAMSSHRPYRPARSLPEILKELRSNRGTKYDANVVDVILEIIENGEFEIGGQSEQTTLKVSLRPFTSPFATLKASVQRDKGRLSF